MLDPTASLFLVMPGLVPGIHVLSFVHAPERRIARPRPRQANDLA
jgi:hypothetical protein